LEALQPLLRELAFAGHRRDVERRPRVGEQVFELAPALVLCQPTEIAPVRGQHVEGDQRRGRLTRELLDARGGGVDTQLQRIEIEPPDVAMTISPSMTQPSGSRPSKASCRSGK